MIAAAKSPTSPMASGKVSIGSGDADPLARAVETFILMYRHPTACEDTITFPAPAWKDALSERQLHERGERFEDIKHQQFGKDGFGDAVRQIAEIEQALGLTGRGTELGQFTAPPPPKA